MLQNLLRVCNIYLDIYMLLNINIQDILKHNPVYKNMENMLVTFEYNNKKMHAEIHKLLQCEIHQQMEEAEMARFVTRMLHVFETNLNTLKKMVADIECSKLILFFTMYIKNEETIFEINKKKISDICASVTRGNS